MFYILNMNQYHLWYYVLQQKKKSQDLVVTIQTNTPNVEPTSQVKFSLLVTQTIDNTRVVATFDNKKSLYSNTSSQYVKQS